MTAAARAAGRTLTVGTRGSALALAQTDIVCRTLKAHHPGLAVQVERITTTGDVRSDVPLSQLARGMFVTEIETALREGRVDVAVHSAKDLPSTSPADLLVAAFLPRADARDVVVSRAGSLRTLPPGARVGTSSPRRECMVRALRPDVVVLDVRGNVDTRLRKLESGEFDAIILAAAGLERLGRLDAVTEWLDPALVIPCVGQGALAVQARTGDNEVIALLDSLDHAPTRQAVLAERAFLAELGAGCRAAVGAHATVTESAIVLAGVIGTAAGRMVQATRRGRVQDAELVGRMLARELLLGGGAEFLAAGATTLRGKRIAITRAEEQADVLSALLVARGAHPVSCPTIAIEPLADTTELDAALRAASEVQWLVFTSANAVLATAQRLQALGLELPASVRLAVVGRATGDATAERIRRPDFQPTRATAECLARELPLRAGDRVLFPRASLAAETLPDVLSVRGVEVRQVVAYRTVPAAGEGGGAHRLASLVRNGSVDAIVFASPSAVRFASGVAEALRDAGDLAPVVVSMGPATTRAAAALGVLAVEPPNQAVGALVETLEELLAPSRVAEPV